MSERRRDLEVTLTAGHVRLQQGASVSPGKAARFLVFVVLSLTVLSLLGQVAVHLLPDFLLRDPLAAAFNVDAEGNIPALYSTLALLTGLTRSGGGELGRPSGVLVVAVPGG
jgi:hypothetical protein